MSTGAEGPGTYSDETAQSLGLLSGRDVRRAEREMDARNAAAFAVGLLNQVEAILKNSLGFDPEYAKKLLDDAYTALDEDEYPILQRPLP